MTIHVGFNVAKKAVYLYFSFMHALASSQENLAPFLHNKSPHTLVLLDHFILEFERVGNITLHPAKTMIGIDNGQKRIAWITQLGKNFVHIVFPFREPHEGNLCFQKIALVPGSNQFNHHLRILYREDVNEEVKRFMKLAYGDLA